MSRLLLLSVIALGAGACSSTAPTTTPSAGPAPTTIPSPADSGNVSTETGNTAGPGEQPSDVIVVAEVPQVVVANAVVAAPKKKVCKRVRPTGSHRTQRICYTESELARATDDAREVFGELHRQQELPNGN